MTRVILTVPGGTTNTFSRGNVSFSLAGVYKTGNTKDGDQYVIAPAGVSVISTSPANTISSGRFVHGAMKNPQFNSVEIQGLDGGNNTSSITGYSIALQINSYPIALSTYDSLLKVRSKDPLVNGTRGGLLESGTSLHVTNVAHSANTFSAPYCWPVGDLANRPWREADVDLLLSSLTTFNTASQSQISWSQLSPYLDKVNIGKLLTPNDGVGAYEYISPLVSDTITSNYDRYQLRIWNAAYMGMMGQTWSNADKTAAAIAMLRRGCQEGEAYVAFQTVCGAAGGGHWGSQYAPCMAWLLATGRTSQYEAWIPYVGGNPVWQYYVVTAGQFDAHTDPLKPYIARQRIVKSVSSDGKIITISGYNSTGGVAEDTGSNGCLHGLNLVKISNGNKTYIPLLTSNGRTGSIQAPSQTPNANNVWTINVDTALTGLAVNDTVYCEQVSNLAVGTVDWMLRNPTTGANMANPSRHTEYRDLQFTAISNLMVLNMRMTGPQAMANSITYMQRAMTPSSNLPSLVDTIDSSITGSSNYWASEFYTAFSSNLISKTQIV